MPIKKIRHDEHGASIKEYATKAIAQGKKTSREIAEWINEAAMRDNHPQFDVTKLIAYLSREKIAVVAGTQKQPKLATELGVHDLAKANKEDLIEAVFEGGSKVGYCSVYQHFHNKSGHPRGLSISSNMFIVGQDELETLEQAKQAAYVDALVLLSYLRYYEGQLNGITDPELKKQALAARAALDGQTTYTTKYHGMFKGQGDGVSCIVTRTSHEPYTYVYLQIGRGQTGELGELFGREFPATPEGIAEAKRVAREASQTIRRRRELEAAGSAVGTGKTSTAAAAGWTSRVGLADGALSAPAGLSDERDRAAEDVEMATERFVGDGGALPAPAPGAPGGDPAPAAPACASDDGERAAEDVEMATERFVGDGGALPAPAPGAPGGDPAPAPAPAPRQITVTVTLGEDKPVTDDELTIFLELSRRVEIRGLSPSSRWRETVVASPADDVTAWKRARDVLESSLPADSFVLKPTVKSRGFILHEGPRHDRALISCGIVGAPPVVFRAFADPRELLGQALSTRALARSLVAAALERQRDFDYDALVASLNAMVFDESDLGIQLVSRRIGVAVEAFEPGAFAKYRKNWTVDFILEGPQATSVGLVLRPAVFATRWRGMADKEGIFRYYGTGRVAAAALAVAHASSNARTRERNGDLL